MGTPYNCLFPRLHRHRFLLLQNRHTVLPVHKLLALIAMDGRYAGFAGAKACREKIRIICGTHNVFYPSTEKLLS